MCLRLILPLIVGLLVPVTAGAATWDFSRDFFGANGIDPNNPFTASVSLTQSLVPDWEPQGGQAALPAWAPNSIPQGSFLPAIIKNTRNPYVSGGTALDLGLGDVAVHTLDPGNSPNNNGFVNPTVTWRAPRDGVYEIRATAWMARNIGRSVTAEVRAGLIDVAFSNLAGSSRQSLGLNVLSTLSIVENGFVSISFETASGSSAGDFAGFSFTIDDVTPPPPPEPPVNTVPIPAAFPLLATALAGLGFVRSARSRRERKLV